MNNTNNESTPKQNSFLKLLGFDKNTNSVKTEVISGLTTFFAMAYIIFVNPNSIAGGSIGNGAVTPIWNAVFVGGIIAAIIGTLLMAFVAKLPFAQAAGMGLNSFFFVSFILPAFINGGDPIKNYGAGLVVILLSGIFFLVLSVTGVRTKLARSLPETLKKSIPAGIGLFIAFIGLKNAGIIVPNQYTFVALADLTQWFYKVQVVVGNGGTASAYDSGASIALVGFIGFILIAIFNKAKWAWVKKGSIILGILSSTVLYYLFTWTLPTLDFSTIGASFSDFAALGLSVFNPSSWGIAFDGTTIGSIFTIIMLIITFCLVDMFDTVGTLYGTAAQANMLDANGDPIRLEQAMLCDSVATVAGACLGTSTVTTYVESSAGVAEGGRTGLTSFVVAACFALALFLTPLAGIIPGAATAPALIYVGVLMLSNFSKVDMKDVRSSVPAFLTLIMMPLTYSIANGIGIGAISYVLITLFTGKYKKNDIIVTVIAVLFAARFALIAM